MKMTQDKNMDLSEKQKKQICKGQKKGGKQEAESCNHKRKRGRPVKFVLKLRGCVFLAFDLHRTEKVAELSDSASDTEEIEMANTPCNMVDADKCSPTTIVDSRGLMVDNMPFLESSPVLRFVQSLEEFQLIPQKPHFRPLCECEEVCREGLALKHMMTFANVVRETSKLQANAPGTAMDSLLNCLPELESHGFNVRDVRSRLHQLQSMKASQEELETMLEKVQSEITMQTLERTKTELELDAAVKELEELEEKMKAAKEKKARLTSEKEEKESELISLKLRDYRLKEDIKKVQHNFERLATSPWK